MHLPPTHAALRRAARWTFGLWLAAASPARADTGQTLYCGDATCSPEVGEDSVNCSSDCGPYLYCGDSVCSGEIGESYYTCSDCPAPYCGDGACNSEIGEAYYNCGDCSPPSYCGDGTCNPENGEDSSNCYDCYSSSYCGDGTCNPENGEDSMSCSSDCGPYLYCGDGTCSSEIGEDPGNCYDCGTYLYCGDGTCSPENGEDSMNCSSDCGPYLYCGDGTCSPEIGEEYYNCGDCSPPPYCGDGACNPEYGEDSGNCYDCYSAPYCGDGTCDSGYGEDSGTCSQDCGPYLYCGDGTCSSEIGEAYGNCGDCYPPSYCGDGTCNSENGEDTGSCSQDCGYGYCGDGACQPEAGEYSWSCSTDCGPYLYCGDGACSGEVGEDSYSCSTDCGSPSLYCGDGTCSSEISEDSQTCPSDCGAYLYCGDGTCSGEISEDASNCSTDCGPYLYCGDGTCSAEVGEDSQSCEADCGPYLYCGDGTCSPALGETTSTCSTDCGPYVPDACDGFGLLLGPNPLGDADNLLAGANERDNFGASTATGDFDGDGVTDLVVGATGTDFNGQRSGAAYLFYGPLAEGAPLSASTADALFFGATGGQQAGFAVANAGDVDGDGIDDLLVGAPARAQTTTPEGRAYLVLGGPTSGARNLGSAADAVFSGTASGDAFGSAVAPAGDLNGDGFADVVIGAPTADLAATNGGGAYVFFGPLSGARDAASADLRVGIASGSASLGQHVGGVGDVNNDGYDDLMVGAPRADVPADASGAAFLFYGGPTLGGIRPASEADATFTGIQSARAGASFTGLGDVNLDGYDDLAIGAKQYGGTKRGAVYVVHGGALSGVLQLEAAYAARFLGENANDLAGSALVGGVDVNLDGRGDLVIGGERADGAVVQSGAAWVVYAPFFGSTVLTAADAKIGGAEFEDFASDGLAAGDINDDGYGDVVVGAWQARRASGGLYRQGLVGTYFGGDNQNDLVAWYPDADGDGFGAATGSVIDCTQPVGFVANNDDCNDARDAQYPGAPETVCASAIDENCDGFVGAVDNDGDGFDACEECDDGEPTVRPGGGELCGDAIDNDCDGLVDDATSTNATTYCPDADGDGFGDEALCVRACVDPDLFLVDTVNVRGDCDDSDVNVKPGVAERCDLIDNNCDEAVDDATAVDALTFYADADADGFGDIHSFTRSCINLPGHVRDAQDCDDTRATVAPGALEVCDFLDNDCDGIHYLGGPVSTTTAFATFGGESASDEIGTVVAVLPDLNGDGLAELATTAILADARALNAGSVFVKFGSEDAAAYTFDPNADEHFYSTDIRIDGIRPSSQVGVAVAAADVNGDGEADLIVGANRTPAPNANQGAVYIYFSPQAGTYTAAQADVILKGEASGDLFGTSIATGDADGDGIADLLIGSPERNQGGLTRNGKAYLIYGRAELAGEFFVGGLAGITTFSGPTNAEEHGAAVAFADLNGDGRDEAIVGSRMASTGAGAVSATYGVASRVTGARTHDVVWAGFGINSQMGKALANAGDVDNDGYEDLIVASANNAAYLVYGDATRITTQGLTTAAAFHFTGGLSQTAGDSVAGAGDVNADGYDDLLIGARGDDYAGNNAGAALLIYGGPRSEWDALDVSKVVSLANIEGDGRVAPGTTFPTQSSRNRGWVRGARLTGTAAGERAGWSVSGGADVNGDGVSDVMLGAPKANRTADVTGTGRAYVFIGGEYGYDENDVVALATQTTFVWDSDADGFANDAGLTFITCPMHAPTSFRDPALPRLRGILASASPALDDCNDANHMIYPGAQESNNDAIDSDCDGFNDTNRLPSLFFNLTPSRITTETTITATSTVSDPDGDRVTLAYDWFIDNRDGNGFIEVLGEETASLTSNFFDRDDIVKLTVTVSDGRGTAPPESKQVTVQNSVPVLSSCNITPTLGGIATDFTATPVGLFDADTEDSALLSSKYRWELRIGPVWDPFTGQTAQTLDSCTDRNVPGNYQNCRRGNSIRAVCIPTDTMEDGIAYPSSTVTLVNLVPVVDQCAITPGAATTDTDLAVLGASSDPDADPTVLTYQWVKNGVDVVGATGTTFASTEFEHFDVINVRCVAFDGSLYGTAVTSTPLVIGNTPPGAPTVDLTPNMPKSNQDLSVAVTTDATDLDGDSITYSYYWTRSGAQFLNPTYPSSVTTVSESATTRNETWEVTVVANDGFADGGSDADAVLILNTEPSVTSATLLPNNPTTAKDITAYGVGFYDDDGDAEDYVVRWYVNGALQVAQTPDPRVLDDAFTVRGDQIYAELVAKDPFSTGNTVTSQTLTVVNTVPTAPVVAITPNPPGELDNLNCGIVTPSTDADGDTITYTYGWTRNGAVLSGETSATLNASATSFADIFTCTVTPNDGFVNGDTGVAPTIAIQDLNAPGAPTISSIDRYRNETSATISGSCVSGPQDCNSMRITCNDGITPDTYTPSCTGNTFSQVVATDRGLTTSCSAVCIDNSANSSLASNTVTTESCNPYDAYETAGTYGDVGTDPIAEWAALADNNSASITILGNIIGSDSRDWYKILTTDNAVADAVAGANAYKFELEMLAGSVDYKFWMHNGSATATAECVGTGPHFGYSRDVAARNDAPNHALATNPNACTSNGSATWSLYNECQSFAMDYYVEVLRPLNTDCQHYQLRAYNGRP